MSDKFNDPIIDACLDEVLGGQRPPNLTARILNAWDDAGTRGVQQSDPKPPANHIESNPAAEVASEIKLRNTKRVVGPRRQASPWLAVVASLALIGLGSAFVWIAWDATERRNQHSDQIADQDAATEEPPDAALTAPNPRPDDVPIAPRDEPPAPMLEPTVIPNRSPTIAPAPSSLADVPIPEINIPDERPAALADEQIILAINQLIRNGWQSGSVSPAPPASDEQWCERVFQKLIGREPRAEELRSFVESRNANKREMLVDLLLDGETYIEEFASYWSQTWADILIASGNKQANRDGLEQYLRRAFGERKPFDRTTYELLTATGSGKIGAYGYNGAANFLLAHTDTEGVHAEASAHVSRTFLAHALECSQCHNDGIWSAGEQQQFWELNAFFRQLDKRVESDRGWVISDEDYIRRELSSEEGEVYYALVNGLLKRAYPVFVDGTEIPHTPIVSQVNRRDLLAKFVTRSEQFRQAMANRFWAEMFGVGFTIPADNIGPHNPPSHPELLAKLGGQFAAHDYDVRALIRWIALSEPFALSSGDVATHDQIGAKLTFDQFPKARDNRVSVLAQLKVAHEAYASFVDQSGASATAARLNPTTNPDAVPTELSGVDKVLARVATEASLLSKATVYGNCILESDMDVDQKIQHMFFATLHRAPTAGEQKSVEDFLKSSKAGSSKTALEYIWWALASSQEAR